MVQEFDDVFKQDSVWASILSLWFLFVMVTTFIPGPNNISSASIGVRYGYRETLKYLTGIAVGFFAPEKARTRFKYFISEDVAICDQFITKTVLSEILLAVDLNHCQLAAFS